MKNKNKNNKTNKKSWGFSQSAAIAQRFDLACCEKSNPVVEETGFAAKNVGVELISKPHQL